MVMAFPGNQGSAESSHDPCNVRPHCLTAGDLFKALQHGVIVKGTALNHHMLSQIRGIGDLNDFKQGVFDHRISQAGGNIRHRGSFLLRLLHIRVHKHGTAGA